MNLQWADRYSQPFLKEILFMRKNRLLILLAFMTVSVCACSSKIPEENEGIYNLFKQIAFNKSGSQGE